MTQTPPIRRRTSDLFLVAAMVLLTVAGVGQRVLERQRVLAAAAHRVAILANGAQANARLTLGIAMRRLDAVAAAAGDGRADGLAESLRMALASVPGARFAALLDRDASVVASAGEPGAAPADRTVGDALARLADPLAPAWYFGGPGGLLVARRVGPSTGVAVLAMGTGGLDQFAAAADLGAGGSILLLEPGKRVILRAPPDATERDSDLVQTRTVLPGQLDLAVRRDRAAVLAAWQARSANTLALLAAVLALLMAGWLHARHRIQRLHAANLSHVRQLAQLATASERLSRLRDVDEIVARAEAIGRALLACERVEVTLGEPAEAPRHALSLLSAGGERLGRIVLTRAGGARLTAEEDLVAEQFARAVASALEGAMLLADTMRSKSELELILSTISDGMVVLDKGWGIRYANAAAARYLQHQREAMLGASLWTLLPGLRDGELGERLQAAAAQDQDAAFTCSYPPLNAWFEMRAYPFAAGLTIYFRDVTGQRETEEKLRQAQKLEAVGQLTGGIAHDVNNLLTVILGNLELLGMRAEDRMAGLPAAEDDEPGLDLTLAEAGLRAGESAAQLMRGLLAFSRHQPLSPQVVAVGDLLAGMEPLVRRTLGEQVDLRVQGSAERWYALVDPSEMESAILNLAINAQDAMPDGGTLTIEASNVAVDRVYAAVAGLDRIGDTIMIAVSDTGTGMPREVLARAFDPFFTTKAPGKGTGLGLAMVTNFARQSGGQAMIDSEPGQGTVVRLYLPRALPTEAAEVAPARAGVTGGSETILLVEDNDLVRAHTEAMLRSLGYDVIAAADGTRAARVLADGLRPDLLLTDVILPGGTTGRDVAEAAQRLMPGLPVLFISGYSGTVLMENGRLPPGVELLGKPFRRSDLAARIRTLLAAANAAPSLPGMVSG